MANRSRRGLHLGDDAARRALWRIDLKTNKVKRIPLPYPRSASPRTKATYGSLYAGHAPPWLSRLTEPVGEQVPTLPTAYRIRPEEKPSSQQTRPITHCRMPCKRQPRRWTASDCDGPSHPSRAPRSSLGRRPPRARPGAHGSPRSLCGPRSTSRIRTEIDLRPRKSGSLAARRQASVRKNVPFAGTGGQRPQQANARPSAGPQKDFGSDEPESTCKQGVFWNGRRSPRGESGVSPTRRRRTSRLRTQKGLQIRARAAEGIRTLDLLHGKQTL